MSRIQRSFVLALLALCFVATQATAAPLTIRGYDASEHDRFYSGSGRDFIGEDYDWSGIGKDSSSKWATMVSSRYFLTATHHHPSSSSTVTFYEDNTTNNQHTYEVDDWSRRIGSTDIYLQRLEDEGGTSGDNIDFYPILCHNDTSAYDDLLFFCYGLTDRVGQNHIDRITSVTSGSTTTDVMYFDYDTPTGGAGDSECIVETGCSGAPSLAVCGGQLALIGLHWLKYTSGGVGVASGDSFVPNYVDAINTAMSEGGDSHSLTVVPEPSTFVIILVSATLFSVWHVRRRRWSQK